MKTYYDRHTPPLKFHKFAHYIVMPATVILGILMLIAVAQDRTTPFPVTVYLFMQVVLAVITFIGFLNFKPYSYYTILLNYFLPFLELIQKFIPAKLKSVAVTEKS
jgi:hypothetical protein